MSNFLIILGADQSEFAKGQYNQTLFDTAVDFLSEKHSVATTIVSQGYDADEETTKFKQADVVIYQYPIYWFTMPAILKKYIDEVYAYGAFFEFTDRAYGTGGLMGGRKVMFSTTWNSPAEAFKRQDQFFEGRSAQDVLQPMRDIHRYCGFSELENFFAHDVVANPDCEGDIKRLRHHLNNATVEL